MFNFWSKRVVALDLSWIRALKNDNMLDNKYAYIIPEIVFHEIAGSNRAEGLFEKVARIIENNADAMFFAHHWRDLTVHEHRPGSFVSRAQIARVAATDILNEHGLIDREWWDRGAQHLTQEQPLQVAKSKFLELLNDFKQMFLQEASSRGHARRMAATWEQVFEQIKNPDIILDLIKHEFPQYAGPK